MGYLLVFLKAIGDAAGAINSLYEFGKNVQEYYTRPTDENRERYEWTYYLLVQARVQLSTASGKILSAMSTLDSRIFQEVLSDKLGDVDQAMQDLDNWRRTQSEVLKGAALDHSAGALADMLQYNRTNLYPRPSVVVSIQVLGPGACPGSAQRQRHLSIVSGSRPRVWGSVAA